MAQQDVLDLVKRNKRKWYTSKELADALGITRASVTVNLSRLIKDGYIERETSRGMSKGRTHRIVRYSYNG